MAVNAAVPALATGKTRRLGVFGGAFDPPHQAHRALASAALQQLQLHELRVVPTGQAWHKPRALTAPTHRLAMARLAFADLPGVCLDEREIHRPGPSYSIDTLRQLQAEQPQAQLYLLLGADQASALSTWHEAAAVREIALVCVAARTPPAGENAENDEKTGAASHLIHLQLPRMNMSATALRQRVRSGQPLGDLVAPAVARYIHQYHLYQGPE